MISAGFSVRRFADLEGILHIPQLTTASSHLQFIFGPELVTVASGETQNPRRNIPKATRRFVYRLIFLWVLRVAESSSSSYIREATCSGFFQ